MKKTLTKIHQTPVLSTQISIMIVITNFNYKEKLKLKRFCNKIYTIIARETVHSDGYCDGNSHSTTLTTTSLLMYICYIIKKLHIPGTL